MKIPSFLMDAGFEVLKKTTSNFSVTKEVCLRKILIKFEASKWTITVKQDNKLRTKITCSDQSFIEEIIFTL
jgi:hypothetical protein